MAEEKDKKPQHIHIPAETVEITGGPVHRGPKTRTINKEDLPVWRARGWRLTSEPEPKAAKRPEPQAATPTGGTADPKAPKN